MKYYEKHLTNIDWDKFTSQEDLLYNDKPIYIKNFIPNPEELLSWKDIENQLNLSLLKFKFLDESGINSFFPPEKNYLGLSIPDKSIIKHHIDNGLTFNCWNYHLYKHQVNSLCIEINEIFKTINDAQIFGSKGSSMSFPSHIDNNPIFAIQTYGSIEWEIYEGKSTNLWQRDQINTFKEENKLKNPTSYILNPGDFLYVPERNYHKIKIKEPRLTLSISCMDNSYLNEEVDNIYYEIKN